jgi:hypothetical protein
VLASSWVKLGDLDAGQSAAGSVSLQSYLENYSSRGNVAELALSWYDCDSYYYYETRLGVNLLLKSSPPTAPLVISKKVTAAGPSSRRAQAKAGETAEALRENGELGTGN